MTNAAKWEEFLRWWEELKLGFQPKRYFDGVVDSVDKKIIQLQKGDNAK